MRLVIRTDAHPVPARAGLESAGQHIALPLAVQVDGAVVIAVPHLQGRAIELHARVLRLAGLEYRAGEHVASELARRDSVGRDGASRDLDGRHGIRRELVGGNRTSHNLGRIDRIRGQLIRIDRASGKLVRGNRESGNVSGLNLMDIQERDGHILGDLELASGYRIGRDLVGRDGQCDDVPRLHRVGGEFRGGHRISHQLVGRDRIGGELVHRDGIGLDLLGGHGIHGEMLCSHRARREDVVRHEVKRLEARTIPRQDFDDAICERHQNAWRSVRCTSPVGVEVGKHGRRIILLALPASPILLRPPPHVTRLQAIMIRLVGATVDQILAIRGGLRLFRGGLSLIRLRRGISGSNIGLVCRILRGLRSRIGLDGGVSGVGRGLIGHSHPSTTIPPFRRVRAIRGVNPQGRSLAHRRGRRRALDKHVGLAVSHASGGSCCGIGLLCCIGRIGGGLGRAIGGGLGLSRHARRIGSSGLGIGRVRLRGGSVRFGGSRVGLGRIGRSIGRVRQSLRIAGGLLGAFGGGLGGIGRVLGLTCGGGSALRGSLSRIGGILCRLRRTIRRVSRALSRLGCGSGILGGLLGVGGLRGVIRDVGLRLSDFVGIALHVGIAHVVPRGTIPDKRVNHAIRQRNEHGRRIIRSPEPVRVKVREQ